MKLPTHYRAWPLLLIVTLLSGCILPWPHTSWRSGEYRGRILDERNRAPIEGAKIFNTEHSNVYCTSGADGRFWLKATYNWHFGYTMTPPESFDYPRGETWTSGITITHADYISCQIVEGVFEDTILLRKQDEPPAPRPSLVFNGNGDVVQDMGAIAYLKSDGNHIFKTVQGLRDTIPAMRVEFARPVFDPHVTPVNNPDKVSIFIESFDGKVLQFISLYRAPSPESTYRLDFTP
jgi:hypothetical protein